MVWIFKVILKVLQRFFSAKSISDFIGAARRKSVFAETYDPEEDDPEDSSVVYPKSDLQRRALKESVKEILLFRSLSPEQLNEVLDAMFEYKVKSGDYIIRQGDDGDNFYVVERGLYNIYVNTDNGNQLVGKCEDSGSFGELALMYNMPRAATIQASVDGTLWALDRQTFRRIVLRSAFHKRKMYEALIENVPLLSALSVSCQLSWQIHYLHIHIMLVSLYLQEYERMNVADALQPKNFSAGQVIVQQGDPADGMFFVEDGIAEVHVEQGATGNRMKVCFLLFLLFLKTKWLTSPSWESPNFRVISPDEFQVLKEEREVELRPRREEVRPSFQNALVMYFRYLSVFP